MSFDYTKHIEKMRQTVSYRTVLKQYESHYGKITDNFLAYRLPVDGGYYEELVRKMNRY